MIEFAIGALAGLAGYYPIKKKLDQKACFSSPLSSALNLDVSPDADEIRILLLGDTGSGDENQKKVASSSMNTCEQFGCDLVLYLGDNFIQDGVQSTSDPQFQYKFEEVYPHELPFYAVLGNHDLRGSWKAQIEYTRQNPRWRMPDVHYSFQAGPVYFHAINTACTMCSLWTIFKQPKPVPWKVIFGHRPYVTTGRHRGMVPLERWLIERSKAQFVFSGHNHILEHVQHKGIDQIISGAGGNPIHSIREEENLARKFFLQDFGYVWGHFKATEANFLFFNGQGEEVYQFTRSL